MKVYNLTGSTAHYYELPTTFNASLSRSFAETWKEK